MRAAGEWDLLPIAYEWLSCRAPADWEHGKRLTPTKRRRQAGKEGEATVLAEPKLPARRPKVEEKHTGLVHHWRSLEEGIISEVVAGFPATSDDATEEVPDVLAEPREHFGSAANLKGARHMYKWIERAHATTTNAVGSHEPKCLPQDSNEDQDFTMELCQAMVRENIGIPWLSNWDQGGVICEGRVKTTQAIPEALAQLNWQGLCLGLR